MLKAQLYECLFLKTANSVIPMRLPGGD